MPKTAVARSTDPRHRPQPRLARAPDRALLVGEIADALALPDAEPVDVSLVVPVLDEEDNVEPLVERIRASMDGPDRGAWELLIVDDGSGDRTLERIEALAADDDRIIGVVFPVNQGKSAALAAGVHMARGDVIVTLDGDLQNDPADIPAMLDALEDHDAVVGYRVERHDPWLRRVSSRVGNAVRRRVVDDDLRDAACALKVFRRHAIRSIPWFGGTHRFLGTLLRYHGFSVVEHPVSHHPRRAGKSKYGVRNRAWRGIKDLLAVAWMRHRLLRIRVCAVTGLTYEPRR